MADILVPKRLPLAWRVGATYAMIKAGLPVENYCDLLERIAKAEGRRTADAIACFVSDLLHGAEANATLKTTSIIINDPRAGGAFAVAQSMVRECRGVVFSPWSPDVTLLVPEALWRPQAQTEANKEDSALK